MRHYWLDLPGPVWFSGADIYRRYVNSVTGPSVAVELGAWKGRSTSFMGVEIANLGKPIKFYTVDHWLGSDGEEAHYLDPDRNSGGLYSVFRSNIAPIAAYVNIIRSDSVAATKLFDDDSIDFLYVDASHTYEGVLGDLRAWYPKVKVGGLIAGDDWCFEAAGEHSVRGAVTDFLGPSARIIAVEPGSSPKPDWLQWSFIKTPGLRVASEQQLRMARLRRLASRTLTVRGIYRAFASFARRAAHRAPRTASGTIISARRTYARTIKTPFRAANMGRWRAHVCK